jgi:GDPmannose 4,6-dehydratase
MQQPDPSDYVIATGVSHSVAEFVGAACALVGLDWEDVVVQSEQYYRPNDIQHLVGNASKAKRDLGWEARTPFNDLVRLMLEADLALEGLSLPCPV